MGEEGLEPPTDYLEGSCSIQLSYSPALAPYPNILFRQVQQSRLYFSEELQIVGGSGAFAVPTAG